MSQGSEGLTLSSSRAERKRSALWALAISIPICIFGARVSMGLAHSGGPLLILFLPTFPAFMLFDAVFPGAPEWLVAAAAAVSEFVGVFVVVHVIRLGFSGGASDDT